MARHSNLTRLDIGLPNPRYMSEKNKRQFVKDCKTIKIGIAFLSMSPEARKLWGEMFSDNCSNKTGGLK